MRIITTSLLLLLNCLVFAENKTNEKPVKYILKISPTVKFSYATSKKIKNDSYDPTHFFAGLDVNFLKLDKKNNYHNVGFIIGFLPNTLKTKVTGSSFSGKQFGVEYNYRIVYLVKKKPNLNLFTEVGTQFIFTKTEGVSIDYYSGRNISKWIESNVAFSPGLQYSKSHFFADFSIPVSVGYTYMVRQNSYNNPILLEIDNNKKYNLFSWNYAFKFGVGAKF